MVVVVVVAMNKIRNDETKRKHFILIDFSQSSVFVLMDFMFLYIYSEIISSGSILFLEI